MWKLVDESNKFGIFDRTNIYVICVSPGNIWPCLTVFERNVFVFIKFIARCYATYYSSLCVYVLRLIIKSKSPGKNSMNDPWHLVNSSLPKRLENHPNNMIFQVFFPSLSQSQKHHEGRLQQQHEHFQTWSSQPQDVTMFFWRIETIPNHSYPSGGWLNWFNPKIYDFMVVVH